MFFAIWQPPADIHCAGAQWLIKLELAGVAPADVEVRAHNNVLSVRGRRRDVLLSGFVCHRLEINYTDFERSFTFPALINASSVACEYGDGILHIWLQTL